MTRKTNVSRRTLLKGGAAFAAATGLAAPLIAQQRSLKIGSYGGYFEDSFKAHVYPAFTEATGITVESVTQPNSSDWLLTMQQAASAGTVPADLSLYARDALIKGSRMEGLLAPLDLAGIPNAANLDPYFLFEAGSSTLGVGAMSWFTSMVINPDEVETPQSWAELWDSSRFEQSLGMAKRFNAGVMDIVAATFFDGVSTFDTKEGLLAIIDKAAELKPNVALWWSAESQMEQAMKNLDVVAGTYYHDVAGIMAAEGFPIASIFPKEGNLQDYGSWCLTAKSEKADEAAAFIDFSCDPASQALMSRMIGTAPLVAKALTDLSDEEFAAVSSEQDPIVPAYQAYLDYSDFISEQWTAMLTS